MALPPDIAVWLVPLIQGLVRRQPSLLALDGVGTERTIVAGTVPFEPDALAAELAGDPSAYRGDLRRAFLALAADPRLEDAILLATDGERLVGCGRDGRFVEGREARQLARGYAPAANGLVVRASFRRTWMQRLLPRARSVADWAVDHLRLPCPVALDGTWPFGFTGGYQTLAWFGPQPLAEEPFAHGSVWGQLADHPPLPGVSLVVHGVTVARSRLPELGVPHLAGIVHCPALTVVDGRIQRDALFARLLASLRPVVEVLEPRPPEHRVPRLPDAAAHPRTHVLRDAPFAPVEIERAAAAVPGATLARGESGLVVQIDHLVLEHLHGGLHFRTEDLDPATEPAVRALVAALGAALFDDVGRPV